MSSSVTPPVNIGTGTFTHESHAQRVRFGSGTARDALREEVLRLGARRVMVIAAPPEADVAARLCAGLPIVAWHHIVAMHVPIGLAERARQVAVEQRADLVISIGGGSTTGLAKAIALTSRLPIIAVPTTYAGSEATSVWGVTERDRKVVGVDTGVLPKVIVYDAALTLTLPVDLTVASGFNALAHCVDSLWAPQSDPVDRAVATEGMRALADGLPRVVAEPAGLPGREQVLYAAYLSALAFASAGSGLHHKICHVLGGMFDLPHAQTHAIVLPHVLAYNARYAPDAERRVANALGHPHAVTGMRSLGSRLGAPTALGDYGLGETGLEVAVEEILRGAPPGNPRPVTRSGVQRLLKAAIEGADPMVSAGQDEGEHA